jgi:predicted NAD/FAD-binding protein
VIAQAAHPRQRIAVVGGGVSGLVAAYLLGREHEVDLFEAGEAVGGHTDTHRIELDGETHDVDTGFIVFNEPNYPLFTRLLEQLGVPSRETTMSFSVRCDRSRLEYNGTSLNRLFAQRRNLLRPRFHRMVADILRFHREAKAVLTHGGDDTSVDDFVEAGGYGKAFAEHYLVPMGSALWSCPPQTFRRFPMRFVVEFFDNHAMLQAGGRPTWRTVTGGSRRYVDALVAASQARVFVNTAVQRITRDDDGVTLHLPSGPARRFDHLILACHSDQALRLLEQPTATERSVLGAFPYQANDVILHTDDTLLPRRRRAWASWNYHLPRDTPDAATVTYNMNILQGLRSRRTFCVTLNETESIDPALVLRRRRYHHPVYTAERTRAQTRHAELIGANRTSYCGAYWGYGFHEDGVRSAVDVCRHFGASL